MPCLLLGYLTLSSDLECVASNDGMMSEQFLAEDVEESCHGRSCSKRLLVGETETPIRNARTVSVWERIDPGTSSIRSKRSAYSTVTFGVKMSYFVIAYSIF